MIFAVKVEIFFRGIILESGIRAVYTKCPNLKVLSLKGCGYVLNDHYCEQIIRVNCIAGRKCCLPLSVLEMSNDRISGFSVLSTFNGSNID